MEQFRTTPTTDRLHLTLTSAEDRQRLQQVLSDLPAGSALHLTLDRPAVAARPHAGYVEAMREVEATYYDAL